MLKMMVRLGHNFGHVTTAGNAMINLWPNESIYGASSFDLQNSIIRLMGLQLWSSKLYDYIWSMIRNIEVLVEPSAKKGQSPANSNASMIDDDVMTRKRFPYYLSFVRGIHRSRRANIADFDAFLFLTRTLLNKQSGCRWFETRWPSRDVIVVKIYKFTYSLDFDLFWFKAAYVKAKLQFLVAVLVGHLGVLHFEWLRVTVGKGSRHELGINSIEHVILAAICWHYYTGALSVSHVTGVLATHLQIGQTSWDNIFRPQQRILARGQNANING